ncbi:MAG: alpha/beta hydrolase [Acidobacteriota bacterium]|nr:alpha/beta hydrolase [Acidobacteriota bacterium]
MSSLQLINSLDIEKTTLVGHSIGGQIAADFTLKHLERVEKLVLVAPGLTGYKFGAAYQQMIKDIWAVVPDAKKMLDIMLNTPEAYAVQEAMQGPQRDLIVKIHRENIEKSLTWKNLEQVWAEKPSTVERLKEIKTETLFIVGTKEKADVLQIGELFKQLSNIQFKRVENADHALNWTHPDEIISAVRNFMKN